MAGNYRARKLQKPAAASVVPTLLFWMLSRWTKSSSPSVFGCKASRLQPTARDLRGELYACNLVNLVVVAYKINMRKLHPEDDVLLL